MRIGGRWGAGPVDAAATETGESPNPDARIRRSRDRSPGTCRSGRRLAFTTSAREEPHPIGACRHHPGGRSVPTVPDLSGPVVIAIDRAPTAFHIGSATSSAPPPPMIVNAPGALGIPTIALSAYRSAEQKMAGRGAGLRHQLEPAGRNRAHRVGPRGRRRRRCTRYRGRPDLRSRAGRHAARQRDHHLQQRRQSGHLCPRDGADAVPARHLGSLRLRRQGRRNG